MITVVAASFGIVQIVGVVAVLGLIGFLVVNRRSVS